MKLSSLVRGIGQQDEVRDVFGGDGSALSLGDIKERRVAQRPKLDTFTHGDDVMAATS